MFNMVEDCNKLNMEPGLNDSKTDELYRSINSTFWKLFGVEFWFNELQCLTQQELHSFLQSSENLKKLYDANIIGISWRKDILDIYIKYVKPVFEKYWMNNKLFETILYANDLLVRKFMIDSLSEIMDFFSEHTIDKAKFDILKKLSEEWDFTPMNLRYKVIALENYLNWLGENNPAEINYKKIKKESILLESREKWAWIDPYGKIVPLEQYWNHDATAANIILGDSFLDEKLSKWKRSDYREFLVQEGRYVKFTGEKFFRNFTEFKRGGPSCFSFPTNPITKRPRVTNEQLDAIIDIFGTIPEELHQ